MQDIIDNYGKDFTKISSERVQKVLNYCERDEEEHKKIQKNVGIMMVNNKNKVEESYKEVYGKKIPKL